MNNPSLVNNEIRESMEKETILVSACLLGIPCQYDGQLAKKRFEQHMIEGLDYNIVPVCPEQLGGLSTPREPVEIQNGDGFDVLKDSAKVMTKDGKDLTAEFKRGAEVTLSIARITKAARMITQKRSPSCSSDGIYDGNFSRRLVKGFGVCAAFLKLNGMEVIDVDQFEKDQGTAP